jgi:hypothetical protein
VVVALVGQSLMGFLVAVDLLVVQVMEEQVELLVYLEQKLVDYTDQVVERVRVVLLVYMEEEDVEELYQALEHKVRSSFSILYRSTHPPQDSKQKTQTPVTHKTSVNAT